MSNTHIKPWQVGKLYFHIYESATVLWARLANFTRDFPMFSLLVIPPNPSSFGKVETWPKWHIFLFNPIRQWAHFLLLEHVGTFGNESVFQIAFRRRRVVGGIRGYREGANRYRMLVRDPFKWTALVLLIKGTNLPSKVAFNFGVFNVIYLTRYCMHQTKKPNFSRQIRYPQLKGRGLKIKEWTDSI